MSKTHSTRRKFAKSAAASAATIATLKRSQIATGFTSPNARPRIAAIGTGSRWYIRATGIDKGYGSAPDMRKYGDYVAVCDVDSQRSEKAAEIVREWSGVTPTLAADYREIIDSPDVDIVHISTPDHWHAKIAIEAMLAGKDVYCEKPMTLTIEEGQKMCEVCEKTGRIVQIGTQQRSSKQFIQAIAMIQEGRLGQLKRAVCSIGGAPTSPSLPVSQPPKHLDWNRWQGPVAEAPYHYLAGNRSETQSWSRCHYEFRWWYEYSGGKMTDWGAHHVDIATWGLNKTDTGPVSINPVLARHPVEFKNGLPTDRSRYNTATEFRIVATFADNVEIEIRHDQGNGILFEGTQGRIKVNRGRITGKPVEELESSPLPSGAMERAYKGRQLSDHFRNFFECATERVNPISDVFSHHRALSTCHLAALSARLGEELSFDPTQQKVTNNPLADSMLARDSRVGFEIEM